MDFRLRNRPCGHRAGRTFSIDGDCIMLKYWSILVLTVLVTGCGCRTVKEKTDEKTVENDIREHLPIGSSKADVIAYLDQRKIGHSWLQQAEISSASKMNIPNSHTERGI